MQGNTIKRVMGARKHSHHSNIIKALGFPTVDDVIKKKCYETLQQHLQSKHPCKRLAIYPPIPLHPKWNHHQGDSSRQNSGSRCRPSGPNHSQITIDKSGYVTLLKKRMDWWSLSGFCCSMTTTASPALRNTYWPQC